jgi:hypothetical protein
MKKFTDTTSSSAHESVCYNVCDGFGCNEKATREINVDAGKFGTLTLFLCADCIGKFEDD